MTGDELSHEPLSERPNQHTADPSPCSSRLKWIVILLIRVIHLRLFDGDFISPKYILYEKINSNKLDPLTILSGQRLEKVLLEESRRRRDL